MLSHGGGCGGDRLGGVIASRTAAALEQAALAGPYFAITRDADELLWRPMRDLLEPAVLTENVDQVRRVLHERTQVPMADVDVRAAASTHALGLASRLVAPTLAAATLGGHVPELRLADLRWQRVADGPVPVGVVAATGTDVATIPAAAAAMHRDVIDAAVAPLVSAFQATFALSPQVLWGNVASALAGAATMIGRSGRQARFDPRQVARHVTATGALTGMGTWTYPTTRTATRTSDGLVFRRNNCCLFYKIPGGGKCGDCVLISNDTLG